MPWRLRSSVLLLAVAGACLGGMSQYQDRDSRGLPKTSQHAPPPETRIDINHANIKELLQVPGMTPSWAGRILRFRPYRAKTDLLEEGVVTPEVYNRIKDFVIAHREAPAAAPTPRVAHSFGPHTSSLRHVFGKKDEKALLQSTEPFPAVQRKKKARGDAYEIECDDFGGLRIAGG
jgi:hypothetical protein